MSTTSWSTRDALDPAFERAWRERLASCPLAHFAFDPAFLLEEARHERHALAVLCEDQGRRAALVMRVAGAELICGWPWRSGAVIEGCDPTSAIPGGEEAEWLCAQAGKIAGGRRLRYYATWHPDSEASWFVAGHTFFQSLGKTEDELWKGMDGAKRRMSKRALAQGYQVVEGRDPELLRAFEALPRDRQRPAHPPARNGDAGEASEPWREWQLPWMWLLLAVRDGKVEAGSGFGLLPGATVDYRTNASTATGKKDGANVLLGWEAIRLGRERGYHWLNWGGATRFKQEFGGHHVEIDCTLGGGPAWRVPNLVDASAHRARARFAAMRRARAQRAAASGGAKSTTLTCWRTSEAQVPEFEQRWKKALGEAALVNFTLDPAYLAWEAKHGRPALAVLCEGEGRKGMLVLRATRSGYVCGWPWRWAAAMRNGPVSTPDLESADGQWLFRQAERAAAGRRIRVFLPVPPPSIHAGFATGATIVQAIDRSDEELMASMHASKRRMVRRAHQEGYRVVQGTTLDQFRTFARIQTETLSRRGVRVKDELPEMYEPGEGWREWELPWMWLLLAERDGGIESGLGDGTCPGGMLEGRTGASTLSGRRAGAFALLCYEEARLARERGYRWLNHGGDTPFKREIAGELGVRLPMYCWLGGGVLWAPANRSETWARQMRLRIPAWARALHAKGAGH